MVKSLRAACRVIVVADAYYGRKDRDDPTQLRIWSRNIDRIINRLAS